MTDKELEMMYQADVKQRRELSAMREKAYEFYQEYKKEMNEDARRTDKLIYNLVEQFYEDYVGLCRDLEERREEAFKKYMASLGKENN